MESRSAVREVNLEASAPKRGESPKYKEWEDILLCISRLKSFEVNQEDLRIPVVMSFIVIKRWGFSFLASSGR